MSDLRKRIDDVEKELRASFDRQALKNLQEAQTKRSGGVKPSECPHCEYDRSFPGFERGGWMQQDNNGPIAPCPICNDSQAYPRE